MTLRTLLALLKAGCFVLFLSCLGCDSGAPAPLFTLHSIAHSDNGFSTLKGISLQGSDIALFGVGLRFRGGLVYDHQADDFYAISQDEDEFSYINRITESGSVTRLFGLGYRFDGGLAFRPLSGHFYAIARNAAKFCSIYKITKQGAVDEMFGLGYGFNGGLTYHAAEDVFYAIMNDGSGFSWLYRITLQGSVQRMFGLGRGFVGGLAYHPGEELFYAIECDENDFCHLTKIRTSGSVERQFGIGPEYATPTLTTSPWVPREEISIRQPLVNERFIHSEPVDFRAVVTLRPSGTGLEIPNGAALTWSSSIDGNLGIGSAFTIDALSVGDHLVSVSGYGLSTTFPLRIFSDLSAFYAAAPAQGEINRIKGDFDFTWADGSTFDESWAGYDNFDFDQASLDPSKLVIIARLDILRHQRFAVPLPFTPNETVYEHIKQHVKRIQLRLDCANNTGGGDLINLGRSLSLWYTVVRQSGDNSPDFCKLRPPSPFYTAYTNQLQLIAHEARHTEPDDGFHVDCAGNTGPFSNDLSLENGSGFARAALYLMWVYKFSLHDTAEVRADAGLLAASLLQTRFCEPPTHSNPQIQAIIDELLP